MLKLVTIGAVALLTTAAPVHPISAEMVKEIKTKATSWTPMEAHLNPLARQTVIALK